MARSGMADLITDVRERAAAGTADYSLAGITYWTDDQLQSVLDKTRQVIRFEALRPQSTQEAGSVGYYDYAWQYRHVEKQIAGADNSFIVKNSAGSVIGTANYTVNYPAKTITFNANTGGVAYYLDYRVYDPFAAAADVWQKKAAQVSDRYDLATDNHDLKRSQLRKAYLENAAQMLKERSQQAKELPGGMVVQQRKDAW